MSIFNTYSQSKKNKIDTFKYDSIPQQLKTQLVHVWNDFFNQERIPPNIKDEVSREMEKTLLKEHSLLELPQTLYYSSTLYKIEIYFQNIQEVDHVLDVVQIFCHYIEITEPAMKSLGYIFELTIKAEDVVNETNQRLKMQGVGYQYINGKIIRLDNELLYNETIEKTITLLSNPSYSNVNEEFLTAHEHFRFNRNADCLTWCLKSYESIIKIIAAKNKWQFDQKDSSRNLTNLLFTNNFFSSFMNQPINNLKALLENSINTIRNKKGGHGAGAERNVVPESLTKYMLFLTGSTLQLLLDTQQEYERIKK